MEFKLKNRWLNWRIILLAALLLTIVSVVCGYLYIKVATREFYAYGYYGRLLSLLATENEPLPESMAALYEWGKQNHLPAEILKPPAPWREPEYRPIPASEDPNAVYLVFISPPSPSPICFHRHVIHASRNLRHLKIEFVLGGYAEKMLAEDEEKRSRSKRSGASNGE